MVRKWEAVGKVVRRDGGETAGSCSGGSTQPRREVQLNLRVTGFINLVKGSSFLLFWIEVIQFSFILFLVSHKDLRKNPVRAVDHASVCGEAHMDVWMDGWMCEWMYGWMCGLMDGCVDRWMDVWVDG